MKTADSKTVALAPPVKALGPVIEAAVNDLAHTVQVPPDLAAQTIIGALSIVTNGRSRIEVADGWTEPLSLYVATVMPPSAGKSPVFKAALKPVRQLEEDQRDAAIADRIIVMTRREQLEADLKQAKTDGDHARSAELAAQLDNTEVPPLPVFYVDDVTPEALAGLFADHGERISVASSEGGPLIHLDRYAKGGGAKLDPWLKPWSNDEIRIARRSHPDPIIVRNPAMSLVLTVQPAVARSVSGDSEMTGRGLPQRIMWSCPDSNVGFRDMRDRRHSDPAIRSQYASLVADLDAAASKPDSDVLNLTDSAFRLWGEFQQRTENDRRPGRPLSTPVLAEWSRKCDSSVIRLAGILCLLDGGNIVDTTHLLRAVQWGNYWISHAIELFASDDEEDPIIAAVELLIADRMAWTGTPTDLYAILTEISSDDDWPETVEAFSKRMKRSVPVLAERGIDAVTGKRQSETFHNGRRRQERFWDLSVRLPSEPSSEQGTP